MVVKIAMMIMVITTMIKNATYNIMIVGDGAWLANTYTKHIANHTKHFH